MKKAKDYSALLIDLKRFSDAQIGRSIACPAIGCLISNFWLYADGFYSKQYQRKEESRIFESLSDYAYGGRRQEQDFGALIERAYDKAGRRIVRINHLCDAILFASGKEDEKALFRRLSTCLKFAADDNISGRMLVYQHFIVCMEKGLVRDYGALFQ